MHMYNCAFIFSMFLYIYLVLRLVEDCPLSMMLAQAGSVSNLHVQNLSSSVNKPLYMECEHQYLCVCVCVCVCARVYVCMHVLMHEHVCEDVCACVYVNVHVCV